MIWMYSERYFLAHLLAHFFAVVAHSLAHFFAVVAHSLAHVFAVLAHLLTSSLLCCYSSLTSSLLCCCSSLTSSLLCCYSSLTSSLVSYFSSLTSSLPSSNQAELQKVCEEFTPKERLPVLLQGCKKCYMLRRASALDAAVIKHNPSIMTELLKWKVRSIQPSVTLRD